MTTILQLCADTGSDTWPYRAAGYEVVVVGADIGVENYHPDRPIHGVIANPVCTEFSLLRQMNEKGGGRIRPSNPDAGMAMVRECQRIIAEAAPEWWAIENPAMGSLRRYLGRPTFSYQPWHFGSGRTKYTALWGSFTPPERTHFDWADVTQLDLYTRPDAGKPSLAFQHRSAWGRIPEFMESGMPAPTTDAELRSMCSQRFARAFMAVNP